MQMGVACEPVEAVPRATRWAAGGVEDFHTLTEEGPPQVLLTVKTWHLIVSSTKVHITSMFAQLGVACKPVGAISRAAGGAAIAWHVQDVEKQEEDEEILISYTNSG